MKIINRLIYFAALIMLCFVSCKTMNIMTNNKKLDIPPSRVIFTFDDGPNQHNETTVRLLDVLNRYDIKGVFCVLGINVLKYPEIVRKMYNDGHIIVNHGFSDKFVYFMNDDEFRENLLLGEKAITEALGFELYPKYYRPQGGVYNMRQKRILTEENYIIVPFTVRILDVFYTSARQERLTKRIINAVKKQNGGIILFHDGRAGERRERSLEKNPRGSFNRSWIPGTVEEMIKTLLDMGYILNEPLDLVKYLR